MGSRRLAERETFDVFLSYSRNELDVATNLLGQLERRGLVVFRDQEKIRAGELWLNKLQDAVSACGSFVVLVGRDGVRRWIGAETQVALGRYFGPHDDVTRLPIFPILLGDTGPETLPAFLGLFQSTRWDGTAPLPESLLDEIAERRLRPAEAVAFEGCPFVGLDAYTPEQARLFFGRQQETLDALACFDQRPGASPVRWLEINGNSGCGKSSLMNAGLLPLVDQGWLWPRTGYEKWLRIGPMLPGKHPLGALAERLARAFTAEMADVRQRLEADERGLADWLRGRKPDDDTAFLLAVDQFEELFTFADPEERAAFDRLLATALEDPDCPLFVVSTVRADFLDRLEELPRLLAARNRLARPWTLPLVSEQGLREIVTGPARLAGLDVGEVMELIVAEAKNEPGALPLVENALEWLWQQREPNGRLSGRLLAEQGGVAGILSGNADEVLTALGEHHELALELLFSLVNVDFEGRRHTRRRVPFKEAVAVAGGEPDGRELVTRLAGQRNPEAGRRHRPLRLVSIISHASDAAATDDCWVDLIHETLIRSRGLDPKTGAPQPYWPTLWHYIDRNKGKAVVHNRARLLALEIEEAAKAWEDAGRDEGLRWPEDRCQEVIREIRRSGLDPAEIVRPGAARAFFGPLEVKEAVTMLRLEAHADITACRDRYGAIWALPLSHRARANLGDRLALIGDTRLGVDIDADGVPAIDWVPIDGGEVTVEARKGYLPDSNVVDRIARRVEPFSIARYPVTIRQFQAFVSACYQDGAWRLPNGVPAGRLKPPPEHRGVHNNCPADNVDWYLAMAFCRWLSSRLDVEVTLPDEWQWQLVATGGDPENVYPWGRDWDPEQEPWRANTSESGLERSTAVGLYPPGATEAGVCDMAGTIWEWCLNQYEAPYILTVNPEEDRRRVLRGGSWHLDQADARCANRYGAPLGSRGSGVGFRVVCSSHIFPLLRPSGGH